MTIFPYFAFLTIASVGALLVKMPSGWRISKRRLILFIFGIWMFSAIILMAEVFNGRSFFEAVKLGDTEQVKELLSEKPSRIHSRTVLENETGLQLAARTGNDKMVALLIKAGADVNTKDSSGIAPLDEAAFIGNATVAESLLNAGADVNTVGGRHNSTPLHVAAYRGHEDVVKLLLAHGANMNTTDSLGETPLQLAIENHQSNVVAILSNPSLPKQSQP